MHQPTALLSHIVYFVAFFFVWRKNKLKKHGEKCKLILFKYIVITFIVVKFIKIYRIVILPVVLYGC